jgi:predicted Rossmann-fold nucleotide-binding protein
MAIAAANPDRFSFLCKEEPQMNLFAEATQKLTEIRTLAEFEKAGTDLKLSVIKGLDLTKFDLDYWKRTEISSTYFLGCLMRNKQVLGYLGDRNAVLLPRFEGLKYNPYRQSLYSPDELLAKSTSSMTTDEAIYAEYMSKGRFSPDVIEALTRRIHDDSIDDALERLISERGPLNIVGFMGGSSNERTDPWYRKTAEVARLVARDHKFVMSGGGPGMMEAANLGAYLSTYEDSALDAALSTLAKAPKYTSEGWRETALNVRSQFPKGNDSLGVPTWFYGFEPSNVFATQIAKYFDNSIREGGLILVARAGVVFAPGSAGTRQEIFMDAAQNHYATTGYCSAMTFLGKYQYQVDAPIFPLLQEVSNSNYKDLLYASDSPNEIAKFIQEHPPKKKEG